MPKKYNAIIKSVEENQDLKEIFYFAKNLQQDDNLVALEEIEAKVYKHANKLRLEIMNEKVDAPPTSKILSKKQNLKKIKLIIIKFIKSIFNNNFINDKKKDAGVEGASNNKSQIKDPEVINDKKDKELI